MPDSKYDDLEYHELQAEAKDRDLSATGSTEELIERLEADDVQTGEDAPQAAQAQVQAEAPSVTEHNAADDLEDDDGFVGVSPEARHRPGSIHYSPKPSAVSNDADDDDDEG